MLHHELTLIVNNTISYHVKQQPISDDEKVTLWHWGIDDKIFEAAEMLSVAGYGVSCRTDSVLFGVPGWNLAIRWRINGVDRSERFFRLPKEGPYAIPLHAYINANARMRHIPAIDIEGVLGPEQASKLHEWAKIAVDLSLDAREARRTIAQVLEMLSTAGQLHRMVPDLVKYLPSGLQQSVSQQQRRSPFPEQWAEFDKSRVERLLITLARGHLVQSMVKREERASGDRFDWAEVLPT